MLEPMPVGGLRTYSAVEWLAEGLVGSSWVAPTGGFHSKRFVNKWLKLYENYFSQLIFLQKYLNTEKL